LTGDAKVRHSGKLLQLIAAVAGLALLTASFSASPLRQSILGQLSTLGSMRALRFENVVGSTASNWGAAGAKALLRPAVDADRPGGFYDAPVQVVLTASASTTIYYTLDGSLATEYSLHYVEPVWIKQTALLSFAGKSADGRTGPVERRTYLVGERDDMPVLSLAVDPAFLWNRHAGIYLNPFKRGKGWRRPAQAEYFADRHTPPLRFPVQVSIHGNWSRRAEKKSFELNYTAPAMPPDRNGILISAGEGGAQRAVVVRATAMDLSYRFGDQLFRDLYGAAGGVTAPAVLVRLLLNGEFWGLYNLHEKIDKTFLRRLYGRADYDLVDSAGYSKSRDGAEWNRLLDFFMTRDLSEERNFALARRLIDLENFTDYWLFNIYAANYDWPQSNYYAFRKREPNERWRWISWDADGAFDTGRGLHHDTLTWAMRTELRHDLSYSGDDIDFKHWLVSTVIIRGLLKHRGYQEQFVRRFCELHGELFEPRRLLTRFQGVLDRMTPHLGADWQRWSGSKEAYPKGVENVRRFIRERPAIVLEHFRRKFPPSYCLAN
jgi:hypothetical protein